MHSQYTTKIPMLEVNGQKIGLTSLAFCKWQKTKLKNQEETPYTQKGREKYQRRTGKTRRLFRQDQLLSESKTVAQTNGLGYNFEYHLNSAYAFNRDKGTCRVCKEKLSGENVEFHRIQPYLSLKDLNRVPNLASVCKMCHERIHGTAVHPKLPVKSEKKLNRMREKLLLTTHKILMERPVKRKFHAGCESGEKGVRTAQNACEDAPYLLVLQSEVLRAKRLN
ncbi:HNH endonuclease [Sporomusa ovata]|uniref:HNH endonuclease n=1 Tax=Sporomusa ovata TaxID=2378 RepID=UPI00048E1DF5|nr:HNH endonuclease signature motif containing protein [Sporomusa ovata]